MPVTPRPFEMTDFPLLCNFLGSIRHSINQSHYLHVGDLSWQLFHMLTAYNSADLIQLWFDDNKTLIGFVLVYPAFGAFEIQVHPAARQLQLEVEMFNWAQLQIQRLNNQCSKLSTLVNEYDTLRISMIEAQNFNHVGDWLYMQRSLTTPLPTPQLAFDFRLSDMTEVDFISRAIALGDTFDAPPRPQVYQNFMNAPGYASDLDIVTVDSSGQVASFALCWVDPLSKDGQFEPVGTRPQFHRQGLGKAVLLEGMRRMSEKDMQNVIVIVEAIEEPAYHLYQSVGLEPRWIIRQYAKSLDK